jgi:hypothetical protein
MIISGGQTGADQGGLYAGQMLDIPTGGIACKGWLTEDGAQEELLKGFGLSEHSMMGYNLRTIANVIWADGTVIFGRLNSPGSSLTMNLCVQSRRPCLHLDVP